MLALSVTSWAEATITVAIVNNGDMVRVQGLMDDFYAKNPDIKVERVTLEENVLRQNVTAGIATGGGQYDLVPISTYEAPIWAKQGWLEGLNDLPADYGIDDPLPAIRGGLTGDGTLYASPVCGESSFVNCRKDLVAAAGITIPDAPTWDDIRAAAAAMPDTANGIYGICLRGKAGWGEYMAFLTTMANKWPALIRRKLESPVRPAGMESRDDRLRRDADQIRPAGASNNGHNENLTPSLQGKCAMRMDATVSASSLTDPAQSEHAAHDGFALAPDAGLGKRANWLWAWSLAIPASSDAKMPRRPSSTGRPTRTLWPLSRPRKAGAMPLRARHVTLFQPGIRSPAVRQDDHRLDQRG